MLFDSHIHTNFSADSEMKAQEALETAARQGIGLVFTEHLDADYISKDGKAFSFAPHAYWQAYSRLRGENLRLGVEIGMRESTRDFSAEFSRRVPFDLVICSQHLVDDIDIYYPDYYEDKDKQTAYHRYLVQMAENLQTHAFGNVLGHIDYICRYAPYEDAELHYTEFADEIDAVLKAAVAGDMVLEINTRRFGAKGALANLACIYKRYRELGGQFVTLGSDAHAADIVGAHLRQAFDFAESLQLTPVTFHQRQMVRCSK
ncbi:MAG: histidinol-phosphatase HisJ family protein [Selenomonas sp.]|uniref:histidinol-phosphatase HisJ family protein n=1 Tax=Selenomonas sp. TaxID=2053611 RepID=UPI0025D74392|nr:histidinol-phosphatase HisJ family protein [Selenomonas sp.]MCR5756998.1 histidinol-phosphatase HisJ family protein [Selenomonas sp.]